MSSKLLFPIITTSAVCLLLAGAAEVSLRVLNPHELRLWSDDRNLAYRFDSELGWFPKKETAMKLLGSNWFSVQHNNKGFRDHHHGPKLKPRIMFIGDSFVWGYDVEQKERFTELLQQKLPDWEMLNLGVSGYGTDQAYLLLQKNFLHYRPDIVFYIFDFKSDPDDNCRNLRYGHYYKPYFKMNGGWLQLNGTPVPKGFNYYHLEYANLFESYLVRQMMLGYLKIFHPMVRFHPTPSEPLILAIREYTEKHGAWCYVGFNHISEDEREFRFCEEFKLSCLDLSTDLRFPERGEHWTPNGHQFVANQILNELKNKGVLID